MNSLFHKPRKTQIYMYIHYVMFQCKTTPDDAHEESHINFQSAIRHFGMLNDSQQWMFHRFVN